MAEGYTRAQAGNIGVCIGTSGPAGTDMITGLYSAQADSIPILCITGQAPRARLHKEDFQAVDIASIAKPVTKWATTVLEPAQVPRVFQQAFHLMRSTRVPGGIALAPVLLCSPRRNASTADFVVPLAKSATTGKPQGFAVIVIDPAIEFLPHLTQWPTETRSAGTTRSSRPCTPGSPRTTTTPT